jgi:hypothetical protein
MRGILYRSHFHLLYSHFFALGDVSAAKPGSDHPLFLADDAILPLLFTLRFLRKLAPFLRHLEHHDFVC